MAYGARLESVLGASPHGFESHILRKNNDDPLWVVFVFGGMGFERSLVPESRSDLGHILRKKRPPIMAVFLFVSFAN
ncbi:MAG: hypothetical protein RL167_605 [Actinomycetota bacterium]